MDIATETKMKTVETLTVGLTSQKKFFQGWFVRSPSNILLKLKPLNFIPRDRQVDN